MSRSTAAATSPETAFATGALPASAALHLVSKDIWSAKVGISGVPGASEPAHRTRHAPSRKSISTLGAAASGAQLVHICDCREKASIGREPEGCIYRVDHFRRLQFVERQLGTACVANRDSIWRRRSFRFRPLLKGLRAGQNDERGTTSRRTDLLIPILL